jgi:MtN3 and saliva related transmembrane protein
MTDWKTYCGMVAGTLTTISFVPQLVKVLETKSAKDISTGMFLIFCTGTGLWLTYGLLLRDGPIIISNSVTLILAMSILILKMRYKFK